MVTVCHSELKTAPRHLSPVGSAVIALSLFKCIVLSKATLSPPSVHCPWQCTLTFTLLLELYLSLLCESWYDCPPPPPSEVFNSVAVSPSNLCSHKLWLSVFTSLSNLQFALCPLLWSRNGCWFSSLFCLFYLLGHNEDFRALYMWNWKSLPVTVF